MSNILDFKTRQKPVEQAPEKTIAEPEYKLIPPGVMLFNVPMPTSVPDENLPSAAAAIVHALAFYARNGWDEGTKAREALMAMNIVVNLQR